MRSGCAYQPAGAITATSSPACVSLPSGPLLAGDTAGVLATAQRFARAGCRYQQARSLHLAGDPGAPAAMAELGATSVP